MTKSLRKRRRDLLSKTARKFLEGNIHKDDGCCAAIIDSCSVRMYEWRWVDDLIQDFCSTMSPEDYKRHEYFMRLTEKHHELRAMLLLMFAEMQ